MTLFLSSAWRRPARRASMRFVVGSATWSIVFNTTLWAVGILGSCGVVGILAAADPPPVERPVSGKLLTRWGRELAKQDPPDEVHSEYPRPQLVRPRWQNLNGLWDYAIRPRTADAQSETGDAKAESGDAKTGPSAAPVVPAQFDGQILVPFPVESTLSRVARFVGPEQELVYRRRIRVPNDWRDDRVLLHFGAVDWEARVLIDGREVGLHRGGYDAFSFDVTDALRAGERPEGEHELVVVVWDPTDAGTQPRGKQVRRPEGIWYTPVTGIWQTVWLEPTPRASVAALQITPNLDKNEVTVRVESRRPVATDKSERLTVRLAANQGKWTVEGPSDEPLVLRTPGAAPWSPATPTLYDLKVELLEANRSVDRVESYFGLRKIALGADANGVTRLLLNGQPLFQFGPLDQGWWPDGLYTSPSDEALRYDLEMTKQYGFNLVRKHVKVEPARWYYHCDRMGLLVWQDMPSGDANARWPLDGTENRRSPESAAQFARELDALLDGRRNDPCIVAWVPFNEAWGQFESERWTKHVKQRDPTRIVIGASGGNDFGVGDVRDIHFYPQPEAPPAESHRAAVLGEYGGLGLPLAGHTWQDEKNWGYRQFRSREEMQATYLKYVADLRPMVESRLSAAIYTQTTDVEIETNGLMTYDRDVTKFDPRTIAAAHRTLYAPLRPLSDAEQSLASAIAYWRFEEGKPGELVPHDRQKADGVAALDHSGHRNHLYAFSADNAPRVSTDVSGSQVPSLGILNRGALDDSQAAPGATRDLYTDPGRSRTHMDAINSFPFTAWTLEASFKLSAVGRDQTLVGEDGRPTSHEEAPLQLLVQADGRLACVVIDRSGAVRRVLSRRAMPVGSWRHAAVVSDGRTMKLWLKNDGDYELEDEAECSGGLVLHDGTWTVGRGFHAGALGRDAQAVIDEVRVSTRALPLPQLLWSRPKNK